MVFQWFFTNNAFYILVYACCTVHLCHVSNERCAQMYLTKFVLILFFQFSSAKTKQKSLISHDIFLRSLSTLEIRKKEQAFSASQIVLMKLVKEKQYFGQYIQLQ
jgi:hypothetical protein